MGRFDEIKNKINANINENGEQRITGQVLNEVLIDEVNTIDEVITELEESIGQGGAGITEEKEVYIGSEEPTDAKLWVDTNEEKIKYKDENGQWQEIAVGGGGEGGTDVDIFPSEYSEEFNDDFTN